MDTWKNGRKNTVLYTIAGKKWGDGKGKEGKETKREKERE